MKILQVIHGYPMRYNAGSEIYTQTLSHGLAQQHEVHVFSREENPFAPDYCLREELDADQPQIKLHIINLPNYKDRYRHTAVDQRFAELLEILKPDVVHIGHLNHLSTALVKQVAQRHIPMVYTLHDYWLMCPRGQFMQMFPENPRDLWAACDGQVDRKCAERCYARYFSGAEDEYAQDVAYWTDWVARRMAHVREIVELVDVFIAPARYLYQRYRDDFGLPEHKLRYLDYGFAVSRLQGRQRVTAQAFTFGYIGTHIPAKGIHQLIQAFGQLNGAAKLRIWGRTHGQETQALRALAQTVTTAAHIEWRGEYRNQDIVQEVFNHVDAIVVPSVWVENSPLVIHEALQARVPVITANAGGMAEYIHHQVNGLCFEHRNADDMAAQMQRFVDDPGLARQLGQRGYVLSEDSNIPDLNTHVQAIEAIYRELLSKGLQHD